MAIYGFGVQVRDTVVRVRGMDCLSVLLASAATSFAKLIAVRPMISCATSAAAPCSYKNLTISNRPICSGDKFIT